MSAKHTPGALVVERFGVIAGGPLLQYARGSARDQIAAVMGSPRITDEERQANARLLAAAYTSYDKHCGPRAVECAEADLLGEALEALRGARECMRHRHGMEANDELAFEKVRAVLAKVKP